MISRRRSGLGTYRVWAGAIGALAALVALLLIFVHPGGSGTGAPGDSSKPVVFNRPDRTIEIGMHIENIHQFSMKDKVYSVEGWYWLKWPETVQKIIKSYDIPLDGIVEFTNVIENTSADVEPDTSKPKPQSSGGRYQLFRFSGRFYVDNLDLRNSPFETIDLPVVVELRPDELSCYAGGPVACVYLKPYATDAGTLVGQYAGINGFKQVGTQITPFVHTYNTTFGSGPRSAFGSVSFSVAYRTDALSAFTQNLLPVLIILAFVLVSPSLPSSMGDVRLAIPATALLTLIFTQQTYRDQIPSLSYVTFMDWLYAFAYLVSMTLFVLFCWGTARYTAVSEADQPATAARIDRVDRSFQVTAVVGLGLTAALALVL